MGVFSISLEAALLKRLYLSVVGAVWRVGSAGSPLPERVSAGRELHVAAAVCGAGATVEGRLAESSLQGLHHTGDEATTQTGQDQGAYTVYHL